MRLRREPRPAVRRLALTTAATMCMALGGGCHRAPAQQSNVLVILVDALRADHLGAYGYPRPTSPTFDALAKRGTLFTRAHSVTSWTNPAVEALFTGEFPEVLQPGAPRFIAPDVHTLALSFKQHGYRTGAIVASPVVSPDLGFATGFDTYLGVSGWQHSLAPHPKEPAERVNEAARAWLAQPAPAAPWFLYLHYMDTHWPYTPPLAITRRFWRAADTGLADAVSAINAEVRQRVADLPAPDVQPLVDVYDAAIAHVDEQLGQLLNGWEAEGRLQNTVVCIVADHGEELGDHGGVRHARTLYEEVLHIPLLVVTPGVVQPTRVDHLVEITDIGRTLLEAAGIVNPSFPGHAIFPVQAAAEPPSFAELVPGFLTGAIHQYALIDGPMKIIIPPEGPALLFDLQRDPGEKHDDAAERAALVAELARAAHDRAGQPRARQTFSPPDPATRERLRALGYDY